MTSVDDKLSRAADTVSASLAFAIPEAGAVDIDGGQARLDFAIANRAIAQPCEGPYDRCSACTSTIETFATSDG